MSKNQYPTFDICNLNANKNENDLLNIDRFKGYISSNPHLEEVHSHSYFHLVYFTKGKGKHIIDFESFPVEKGMIYFMKPSQVHQWSFEDDFDGYVINFSAHFFDWLKINSTLLDDFSFFRTFKLSEQVVKIKEEHQTQIEAIFEKLLNESLKHSIFTNLQIALTLIELFIAVERIKTLPTALGNTDNSHSEFMKRFQKLLENNFKTERLPKNYAANLNVTTSFLNSVCKEFFGKSSGEMIRDRVILEAKRLLVNFDLTINQISYSLNFNDNSYFVKFFKKYTGLTPDQFRKTNYL